MNGVDGFRGGPSADPPGVRHDRRQVERGAETGRLFQLRQRCRDGDGVPEDDVLAYRWMEMSIRNEPDESLRAGRQAERDTLAARMRPDEVARAQAL